MRSIGIREFGRHVGKYLRLVREGESIEITDRGEPIAMITPVPKHESNYERLKREGKILPAEDPDAILRVKPVPPAPGVPLPSQLLEEDRTSSRL